MTTQQQYLGQFSGEDYPTFQEWRKAFRAAMETRELITIMDSFDPFIDSGVFMDELSLDELAFFADSFHRVLVVAQNALQRESEREGAES